MQNNIIFYILFPNNPELVPWDIPRGTTQGYFNLIYYTKLVPYPPDLTDHLHYVQVWRPYAFLGMLMQFPLVVASSFIKGQWGNVFMWCSLIIGQPLAILFYYHDWLVANRNN